MGKKQTAASSPGTAAQSTGFRRHLLGIVLLSAAAFLAYSNSLHGIWAFDDVLINQYVGLGNILEKTGPRIVSFLSFAINQKINPYDQFNYRLLNLFIHIANSLLVYGIAFLTLKFYDVRERGKNFSFFAALLSAAVFALHPLNINAVAYIIQRMASLAAFFVLLALLLYIIAGRTGHMVRKAILYCATAVCIILGILSKENAVMGIPLILLYEYIFIARFDKKAFWRKARIFAALSFCALVAASFYAHIFQSAFKVAKVLLNINQPMKWTAWMATDIYWSPLEHILTELRVVSRYLFLFIFPLPRFLIFDWWGYPISKGLFTPLTTFFSLIFIGTALGFSIFRIKKYPFLSFGILWYFIAISLESFIAVGSDLYFEHRNYLPLAGLCFGVVVQVLSFFWKRIQGKYVLWSIFLAVSLVFGGMTFQRNFIWNDPIIFWKDIAQKAPDNPRAAYVLANCYFGHSYFEDAEKYYRKTIELSGERKTPAYLSDALYRLGFMYLMLERLPESREIIDTMNNRFFRSWKSDALQGLYLYQSHDYKGAISSYLRAQEVPFAQEDAPQKFKVQDRVTVLTLTGDAYRAAGEFSKARDSYEKALTLSPLFSAAHHGMAKLDILQRRFDAASEHLREALIADPYNIMILSDKANLTLLKGEGAGKALPFAQRAVVLNPPFYQPYLIMGTILVVSGDETDADRYYARAAELHSPDYQLLFNKAWGYSLRGEKRRQSHYLRELLTLKEVPDNIRATAKRILAHLNGS